MKGSNKILTLFECLPFSPGHFFDLNPYRFMRKEDLEAELILYWVQNQELDSKGGPEQDGDLFEEIIEREENLLAAFGLPPAQKFSYLLWKFAGKKSCSPKVLQNTISKLQNAAEEFLAQPVKPSLEILKQALKEKASGSDILPELGFITHDYTYFLYNNLLLTRKVAAEAILEELEKVREWDLYGPVANLKFNLPPAYRRSRAYQELKSQLQFLDAYLETNTVEFELQPLLVGEHQEANREENADLFSHGNKNADASQLPEPKPYNPEYKLFIGRFEILEIIFDADSAVTVNGNYYEDNQRRKISLGFEFEELYRLFLQHYDRNHAGILNYFNHDRQLLNPGEPTIIDLKNKTGRTLNLDQHYFRVYKPHALDRDGRAKEMTEEFYLVDKILDKKTIDKDQQIYLQNDLNGWFRYLKNWYAYYLHAKQLGSSEAHARKSNNLENNHLFQMAELIYQLEKHGGQAKIGK